MFRHVNIYTSNIIPTEKFVFRNMHACTYIYMHATTITEKRSHEFEREQECVYGKAWREEREEEMMQLL